MLAPKALLSRDTVYVLHNILSLFQSLRKEHHIFEEPPTVRKNTKENLSLLSSAFSLTLAVTSAAYLRESPKYPQSEAFLLMESLALRLQNWQFGQS